VIENRTEANVTRAIDNDGVRLAVEEAGEGTPVLLMHGLTATRRYVVMGSKALERDGHRVVLADARGHGASSPAATPGAYEYADLAADAVAILDALGIERAVLAGASMGAGTAARVALGTPERVAGLVLATPAFLPGERDEEELSRWDRLGEALRSGGVEGFVEAYGEPEVPERFKETVIKVVRQRLAAHEHPGAVADALHVVPRSEPFASLEDLARIEVPTTIVPSRDEGDPGHPFAVGEEYARRIPGAQLVTENEGKSPLAWQGGQLSRVIAETAARTRP